MTAWLVALLLATLPVERTRLSEERYREVAADVDAVVRDAAPLFGGSHGRERTAALLLAVAYMESGLRDDNVRGKAGECGLWQTMPVAGRCPETRRDAAALALDMMRRSFTACRASPIDDRLAVYASGRCDRGLTESRARMQLARRWYAAHPPE
jgi:hypothetical protein